MITSLVLLAGLFVGDTKTDEVILINNILEARTEKCWTRDRLSNKTMVSVAATGVGFYAYAKASQHSIITREEARSWIRTGFYNLLIANKDNSGWFYHFTDLEGRKYRDSEISSIDTIIAYAGAERAAELLQDQALLDSIRLYKRLIDRKIMIDENGYYRHGWVIEDGRRKMLKSSWRNYNEGILIYKYLEEEFKPIKTDYDLPLFCYFYPLAFFPDERSWIDHLGRAIDYQISQTGRLGYSAMDTPTGYQVNSPFCISPVAIYSCQQFFPSKCKKELAKLSVDRLTQSVSVNGRWSSNDHILLDDGIALMLIKETQ